MSLRLGVLGGMFDPVHNGHIEAARFARQMLGLDEVHLVPCHIPNHRKAATGSAADRLAMLQRAVTGITGLRVNPIELNRNQVSYMVDTLTAMRAEMVPGALVLVAGMDSFNTVPTWHAWRQLFELCHFFVLARNAESVCEATAKAVDLASRQVYSAQEMFGAETGKIWIAGNFRVDLSSSKVREAIRQQQDLSTLLDARVIEYINHNSLYRAAV